MQSITRMSTQCYVFTAHYLLIFTVSIGLLESCKTTGQFGGVVTAIGQGVVCDGGVLGPSVTYFHIPVGAPALVKSYLHDMVY